MMGFWKSVLFSAAAAAPMGIMGLVMVRYPTKLARMKEQVDAIGSTRHPRHVEPAGWNVALTKYSGYALVGWSVVVFALVLKTLRGV